jgi:hypothetical protein
LRLRAASRAWSCTLRDSGRSDASTTSCRLRIQSNIQGWLAFHVLFMVKAKIQSQNVGNRNGEADAIPNASPHAPKSCTLMYRTVTQKGLLTRLYTDSTSHIRSIRFRVRRHHAVNRLQRASDTADGRHELSFRRRSTPSSLPTMTTGPGLAAMPMLRV